LKFWKYALILFIILFLAGGFFYFQKKQEEKYIGFSIIPERTEDIPLYSGLEPASPVYTTEGDHWEEIMHFYENELPNNEWSLAMLQASSDKTEDGAGFISYWEKEDTPWVLTISAAYYKNSNITEVVFDKREQTKSIKWIGNEVSEVCINEQPDRSVDCFKITEKQTIEKIIAMINDSLEADAEPVFYNEKSVIDFGSISIDVYYDLEKGIYFVSDQGVSWMKPEREFFELTRISKEY
jgi:prolyl-tRNA synthetase